MICRDNGLEAFSAPWAIIDPTSGPVDATLPKRRNKQTDTLNTEPVIDQGPQAQLKAKEWVCLLGFQFWNTQELIQSLGVGQSVLVGDRLSLNHVSHR